MGDVTVDGFDGGGGDVVGEDGADGGDFEGVTN